MRIKGKPENYSYVKPEHDTNLTVGDFIKIQAAKKLLESPKQEFINHCEKYHIKYIETPEGKIILL